MISLADDTPPRRDPRPVQPWQYSPSGTLSGRVAGGRPLPLGCMAEPSRATSQASSSDPKAAADDHLPRRARAHGSGSGCASRASGTRNYKVAGGVELMRVCGMGGRDESVRGFGGRARRPAGRQLHQQHRAPRGRSCAFLSSSPSYGRMSQAHASRSSIPAPCTPSRVRESRSARRAALGGGVRWIAAPGTHDLTALSGFRFT